MSNPNKKKGCGCVGKGCFLLIVIAVVFIGLGVWGYKKVAGIVRAGYSSDGATRLPGEKVTEGEYDTLVKRLDAFKNAPSGSPETLQLTAHDFNLLIAYSPEWESVRGKINASIDKDQMALGGSLPLNYLPELRDQFLNGWIYFTPTMEDKVFHLSIQRINLAKSGEFSKDRVTKFSNISLLYLTNELLGDPVIGPVLIKAKALKVKDGAVVLTPG